MSAFQRLAVFAAVAVLLAVHAGATAPVTSRATCNFPLATAPAKTSDQYNNYTQFCCPTGIKNLSPNSDPYQGCCHDNTAAQCPGIGGVDAANQITCCRPEPARVSTDTAFPPVARDCYNPAFQSCCKVQYNYKDTTTTPVSYRLVGSAQVFDSETQKCCATGTSQPIYNGQTAGGNHASMVIVPKSVASCIQYLANDANTKVTFQCQTDSQCPDYRSTGEPRGKCCRRPKAYGETDTNYDKVWGTCYDAKFQGCCNSFIGDFDQSQSAQANSSDIYDLRGQKCCKLPTGTGATQSYIVNWNDVCPCLADSDCPNANYTCCAPSQTQLQGGTSYRRLVQCNGAAGAPTSNSSGASANFNGAHFPGCYGKCIASSGASGPSPTQSAACVNSLPSFVDQCKDLRVESIGAFSNIGGEVMLSQAGNQWAPPTADDLIVVPEYNLHNKDCCKNENGFSVLYDVTTHICCPVMGSAPQDGTFPRRLSPVVPRSGLLDLSVGGYSACLCAAESDCQTGYKCCDNGNSWILDGYGGSKQNQLQYTRPDGTLLTGICINANTTECCKADRINPDLNNNDEIVRAQPYFPSQKVCCADGSLQTDLKSCGCHTNADCPGEFAACCTANTQFGTASHGYGQCYDTRTRKCCQYHTKAGVTTWPLANPILAFSAVYDDSNQVCCPWGGPASQLSGCACRSDAAETDCGKDLKCCSNLQGTVTANTTQYRTKGQCYDPKKNQGCCQSKTTIVPTSTVIGVYDTARQVCCPVNGVKADHRECSCSSDAHCPANGECCVDAQWKEAGARVDCSDFTDGTHCPGKCIHKEIETCCDKPYTSEWKASLKVNTCVKDYQKCCDGDCCNKATQTCKKTTKNPFTLTGTSTLSRKWTDVQIGTEGAVNAGYHYGLDDEQKACTTLEHSSPSIVFHTWVFPTFLSVACIIVVLLGSRAGLTADFGGNMHRLALVGIQVFVAVLAILLLWSPLWKYGFGVVFANSFILHSFVVGGQWTRRFAVILLVVTFLWVYEPFGTNVILSFGTVTFRGNGQPDDQGNPKWPQGQPIHGLNYAARMLQRDRGDTSGDDACTEFYMYWKTDANLHDARTWNPQGATRGICRRSWMHTIVVLAGILTPFEAVWLFLAAIALARASQATKDVKVQPIQA